MVGVERWQGAAGKSPGYVCGGAVQTRRLQVKHGVESQERPSSREVRVTDRERNP